MNLKFRGEVMVKNNGLSPQASGGKRGGTKAPKRILGEKTKV